MNDLPAEISSMFIIEEKMTGNKTEILNFCDSVQCLVEHVCPATEERLNEGDQESNQPSDKMQMETFNYEAELETIEEETMSELSSVRGGRGRGGRGRIGGQSSTKGVAGKRGRSKNTDFEEMETTTSVNPIIDVDDESSDTYTFLEGVSNKSVELV